MQTKLTAEERVARAKLAAEARWSKEFDWDTCTMSEGMSRLTKLRAEAERGGLIMQRRTSQDQLRYTECYNPSCMKGPADKSGNPTRTIIDIGSGRFAGYRSRTNPETGQMESAYACSAACFLYIGSHFTHFSPGPRDISQTPAEPEAVINEAARNIV